MCDPKTTHLKKEKKKKYDKVPDSRRLDLIAANSCHIGLIDMCMHTHVNEGSMARSVCGLLNCSKCQVPSLLEHAT